MRQSLICYIIITHCHFTASNLRGVTPLIFISTVIPEPVVPVESTKACCFRDIDTLCTVTDIHDVRLGFNVSHSRPNFSTHSSIRTDVAAWLRLTILVLSTN
jgi:hypothetical protein